MIYDILLVVYVLGTIVGLWFIFKKTETAAEVWEKKTREEKLAAIKAPGVYKKQEQINKALERTHFRAAPWVAVVPVYNIMRWVYMCGKNWTWYIGFLIPGFNIFLFLLLVSDTARAFGRTNIWEQLAGIIFPFVYMPIIGLSKWEYKDPAIVPPAKITQVRDWGEAILFAVVTAVLIRGFVFELFSIPSSSMEGSLMTGDHLIVSKMAYGPRVIQTPLSLPLVHNLVPGINMKSYTDWPHFPYHRYPGYTKVKRFDAVVFNFPAGDTILSAFPGGQYTYYQAIEEMGREAVLQGNAVHPMQGPLGHIATRPVDKRENYIKRCIGLPGEDLQIVDRMVYINGKAIEQPENAQFRYDVTFAPVAIPFKAMLDGYGVSGDDINYALLYPQADSAGNVVMNVVLTEEKANRLRTDNRVLSVEHVDFSDAPREKLFPYEDSGWTLDNYGPIHIPAAGEVLHLTVDNLPMYRRVITAYEGNTCEVRDGKIFINGQQTDAYTVKQNYYWMMGDNRHNSQDSRFWGYVPEDHISGRALRVLWSMDKDHGGFRKGRFLKDANAM